MKCFGKEYKLHIMNKEYEMLWKRIQITYYEQNVCPQFYVVSNCIG